MMCRECNTENPEGARFCSNCGHDLRESSLPDSQKCPECGYENLPESRYCAECGVQLRAEVRHKRHGQHPKKKKNREVIAQRPRYLTPLIIAGIAGAVLLFALALKREYEPVSAASSAFVENRSLDPKIEIRVKEIASKFACSCGTCNELPLDTCSCAKAVEERQYIRDRIQSGETNDQIVQAINSTYGWMKKGYAVTSGSFSQKGPGANPGGRESQRALRATGLDVKVATTFDRIEIFSHFMCPCGQCGIDELKDCNCDHPRGATEVKAFVDQKIDQQKYTTTQLIVMVEKQYGNRKF